MQKNNKKLFILMVGDQNNKHKNNLIQLREVGFRAEVIYNGLKLYNFLAFNPPDFLILDTKVTWISVYQVPIVLKQNPELKSIKILLLLDEKEKNNFDEYDVRFIDQFIIRPLKIDYFINLINKNYA